MNKQLWKSLKQATVQHTPIGLPSDGRLGKEGWNSANQFAFPPSWKGVNLTKAPMAACCNRELNSLATYSKHRDVHNVYVMCAYVCKIWRRKETNVSWWMEMQLFKVLTEGERNVGGNSLSSTASPIQNHKMLILFVINQCASVWLENKKNSEAHPFLFFSMAKVTVM